MNRVIGFLAGVVVVALAIAGAVVVPRSQPVVEQMTLPVARMLACPVGTSAVGETTVTVTDQQDFTAGVLSELPSDPVREQVFDDPTRPIIVRGSATVGGMSTYTEPGGTLVAPCASPITQGTWDGVLAQIESPTLVLTNVDAGAAVVDVFLYGLTGPLSVAGLRDITVGSGRTQMLALDSLVEVQTPISVQIRASKGRVAAVMRHIGDMGYDWQMPQATADTDLVITGIPAGGGGRTLSVTNTDSSAKATVTVEVLGEAGRFAPLGYETIEIPPSRTTSVDVGQVLGGQASAIHLSSDRVITAAVTVAEEDIAAISAQPALNGAVVTPPVAGTLWAANPSTEPAVVTVRFDDASGAMQTTEISLAPGAIGSVEFPSQGTTVRVTSEAPQVRTSLVVSDQGLAVLPLSGGGTVTTVDVPSLDPGLG